MSPFEQLRENAGRARLSYEIFPQLPQEPAGEAINWFEIALHAEAVRDTTLDGGAIAVLQALAGFLARSLPREGGLRVSPWYYTAQPESGATIRGVRLFRTVSIVVFDLPPYRAGQHPPLLAEFRKQLERLQIGRWQPMAPESEVELQRQLDLPRSS